MLSRHATAISLLLLAAVLLYATWIYAHEQHLNRLESRCTAAVRLLGTNALNEAVGLARLKPGQSNNAGEALSDIDRFFGITDAGNGDAARSPCAIDLD